MPPTLPDSFLGVRESRGTWQKYLATVYKLSKIGEYVKTSKKSVFKEPFKLKVYTFASSAI